MAVVKRMDEAKVYKAKLYLPLERVSGTEENRGGVGLQGEGGAGA